MSRTFITGDIHGDPFRFSHKNWPVGKELTKEDVVIVLGDFGMIWMNIDGVFHCLSEDIIEIE